MCSFTVMIYIVFKCPHIFFSFAILIMVILRSSQQHFFVFTSYHNGGLCIQWLITKRENYYECVWCSSSMISNVNKKKERDEGKQSPYACRMYWR